MTGIYALRNVGAEHRLLLIVVVSTLELLEFTKTLFRIPPST
jgi:hypothetical protein